MAMVLARATENVLTGHVALSREDFEAFVDSGVLEPEIFDYTDVWGLYVPLDATKEAAVETALLAQGTSKPLEAAVRDTTWVVLKVRFVGPVIADMFQGGRLHFSTKNRRLELWTPILAEWLSQKAGAGPQVEVTEVELPPMGLDEWGDRVLSEQFSLRKWTWRATCEQCSAEGRFLWLAEKKKKGGGRYCAGCWHDHCGRADWLCDSLHELRSRAQLPPAEWGEEAGLHAEPWKAPEADADAESTGAGSSNDADAAAWVCAGQDGSQW